MEQKFQTWYRIRLGLIYVLSFLTGATLLHFIYQSSHVHAGIILSAILLGEVLGYFNRKAEVEYHKHIYSQMETVQDLVKAKELTNKDQWN